MTTTITTAEEFLDTLGVNAHISQGTVDYANSADVIADLKYLGLWNVRDSYNSYWESVYAAVAADGGKFDFISAVGGSRVTSDIIRYYPASIP